MSKFKSSLTIGAQGEKAVREFLSQIGFDTKESTHKEIDLYFTCEGKEYSGEVKWDLYSARSGNFCIETYNTKISKPSGLMSTLADFWFHLDSAKKIYFARVSSLKDFIEKVNPKKEITSGGDDNANLLLYAMDVICGECLLELTKDSLIEEIKKL